ncbi:hypothetical protein F9C07_165 [Aspergillus flavus]|uniref:Uncharacterized protein n=1 Tax=Aspergillus flavus (strain ATCC 200026 / FGSC A1120 / IAM 13836 / NRRL 3357 / JCM 12722 / SRRC 167) TaxID=332952 RepID=A0A7U2QW72_ASPFN|nr:hypothetical protein F9C07_165 [Aspergillus flavus]
MSMPLNWEIDSVYQLFLLSGRFLSDVLFKSFAPNTKSLRTAKVNWSQKDPGICTLQSNSLGVGQDEYDVYEM